MSETNFISKEMPKLACGAVVLLGYAAACVSIVMNARYGQRMSIDVDGHWLNGIALLVISLGPAAITSYSGFAWRARKRLMGLCTFAGAALLMLVSAYNANDFLTSQMVGKVKATEKQQDDSKGLTETRNNLTLEERKDLRESYRKKYDTARTKEERDDAGAKLEALTNRPIELQATGPNVDLGTRSNLLSRWLGVDRDTILGVAPASIALAIVLMELFLPFVGFSGWPTSRPPAGGSSASSEERKPTKIKALPDLRPKTTQKAAYDDLKQMLKGGVEIPSQAMLARRWNVSEVTVHTWLGKWPEFHRNPAETGRRNRIVLAHHNGNGRLLTQ